MRNDGGTILEVLGGILQDHPRLNLVVNVSAQNAANSNVNSNTNSNLKAEKETAVKKYFSENWNIKEDRFLFSEGADNFRLVLNE